MKKRNYLKGLRVLLAILFFVPILLFFVDFSGVLPDSVHRLLHLQLMPALLGGMVGLIVFQFLLALEFGRIYCSTICPAGVFQDIINRLFCIGKKKKKGSNPSAMRCQYSGGTVVLRSADGIYHENHSHTMLYVCSNYPRCDAYVRTHPGTNIPVGTLANRELRTLRNQAHHYFDQLYLSGLMSKQDAYLWLGVLLQVPLSKAHIGFLGEYYCNEVIAESKTLLERRWKQQPAGFRPCKGGEAS